MGETRVSYGRNWSFIREKLEFHAEETGVHTEETGIFANNMGVAVGTTTLEELFLGSECDESVCSR